LDKFVSSQPHFIPTLGRQPLLFKQFLSTFLDLTAGIPSHDTFRRVFGLLDSEQFQACFLSWVHTIERLSAGEVIAIDVKRLCGSQNAATGKTAINMVSA